MGDPTAELRERHEQEKNETPQIDDGPDDVDDGGGGGIGGAIPTPSVDKKLMVGIAVVAAAIIAWQLYKRQQSGTSGSGGSLDEATGDGLTAEATIGDDELEQEDIRVPSQGNATEKDAAVTEAFRKRGVLSSKED